MNVYRDEKLPFPDGSVLVKLSWKREPLAGFEGTFVPGEPTMVQVMVKDAKKYADTGGWGFGRFVDGQPADEARQKTWFAWHSRNADVKGFWIKSSEPRLLETSRLIGGGHVYPRARVGCCVGDVCSRAARAAGDATLLTCCARRRGDLVVDL